MLIRSQDKSRLINFKNIHELRFWECEQGFDITDCVCPVGHYSTKEKVLKVLNMIQEAYINGEVAGILAYGLRMVPTEEINEAGRIIKNAIQSNTVFQMPEDSEVE